MPQYLRPFGDFDGAAMFPTGSRGDPGHWFTAFLSSSGANNVARNNYPELDETSPNVKVLQHSCGAVAPLIPEFIQAGVDALNLVQTTAEGMDPATLKREFGKDIVFWGGCVRCQTTLANGTADDVRREVKELVETWKPGGGYVFCPDHDIQENVPAERIVTTYEAAQEFGRS